ncbi:phytase [Prosthecochloris aestuarii DSM 271]|uniref:Phytase n=1 Tax=Prosthecochloris aestuarii (strain DSM 271 / SK 413) TaxID=290512 RepID=B4S367_PROA2|nr:phytase [Prosthecochloris aestuarii]ACF45161.1 phytase [Prosthecochloris aestuarii DSM 271]
MKNHTLKYTLATLIAALSLPGCNTGTSPHEARPLIVTEQVPNDSDDPAIWINREDPSKSLVLGTDKDANGGVYVFDLKGRILKEKTVTGLARPNNIDIGYGLMLGGKPVDIAVVTERLTSKLRVFALPGMEPIDNGGLPVFENQKLAAPMGIALYKRPSDNAMFAVVSRKQGPQDGTYLWQYLLEDDGSGQVIATKVREFGAWSGKKEIEAVAVDNEAGRIYYSDEGFGIRSYRADPEHPDAGAELALFATEGITRDHEGIAIVSDSNNGGWIIVSDQSAGELHLYSRNGGTPDTMEHHTLKRVVKTAAIETDGIEAAPKLNGTGFPKGLFVAMSDDRTFQYYSLEDIIGTQ